MNEEFKDRLRKAREKRKLSQSELAKKAGLQPAAISHFETGNRTPSFDNLRKLADALSIGVDSLLGRIEEGNSLETSPRGRELFRHAENLSEESLSLLESMAETLSQKDAARREAKSK